MPENDTLRFTGAWLVQENQALDQHPARRPPLDASGEPSPLLDRRGGCGIKKMARSDLSAAAGVVEQVQKNSVDRDPPPRPLHQRKLRDIFLNVASTPPVQEGRSLACGCFKV